MKRDYVELFQKITYAEPRQGFEQSIINRINKIQERKLFIKEMFYAFISIISFVGVISSVVYTLKALSTSGVYQYISLLFTDAETFSYLKEFSLSIAESMPFMKLTLVCAVIAVFIWSLLKTIKIYGYKQNYTAQIA